MKLCWIVVSSSFTTAVLFAIAFERARAYGGEMSVRVTCLVPAAAAVVLCAWLGGRGNIDAARILAAGCGAACAASDIQTGYVFDRVLIVTAVLLGIVSGLHNAIVEASLGAALAAVLMGAVHVAGRGRTLGLGDVKLASVFGMALGPEATALALWFAVVIAGSASGVLLAARRVTRSSELRFAPYLSLGACCAVLWLDRR